MSVVFEWLADAISTVWSVVVGWAMEMVFLVAHPAADWLRGFLDAQS
jgi:hypothetical protein